MAWLNILTNSYLTRKTFTNKKSLSQRHDPWPYALHIEYYLFHRTKNNSRKNVINRAQVIYLNISTRLRTIRNLIKCKNIWFLYTRVSILIKLVVCYPSGERLSKGTKYFESSCIKDIKAKRQFRKITPTLLQL